MTIHLTLPWPPSVNTKFNHVRYLSAREKAFNAMVQATAIDEANGKLPKPLKGRVQFSIFLHAATLMKYDIDNYAKAVIDGCVRAGLMDNDHQIDKLYVERGKVWKGVGGCRIVISEIV